MAIAIEWEDGTIDRGPTPESVISLIGEVSWDLTTPDETARLLEWNGEEGTGVSGL
jgi:hypothetical protein